MTAVEMTSLRARILSWPALAALVVLVVAVEAGAPSIAALTGAERSADARFSALCRERGGTPTLAPGSGDYVKDARSCEIRYGRHTYEMYAIMPDGFDEVEARRAGRACDLQAARAARGNAPAATIRHRFHPRTAI